MPDDLISRKEVERELYALSKKAMSEKEPAAAVWPMDAIAAIRALPAQKAEGEELLAAVLNAALNGEWGSYEPGMPLRRFVEAIREHRARTALASNGEAKRLREACEGIADDYITSDTHHPNYVLIPTVKFKAICTALGYKPDAG